MEANEAQELREHAEHGADAGVTRRVRHRLPNLSRGGFPPLVENFEYLPFAPAEALLEI